MKGDAKIIAHLNKVLGNELVAINQYFLHSKMFHSWGMEHLGTKLHEESIEEMKHADWLIERILLLEGLPNLQDLGILKIGQHTEEMLQCDLDLELQVVPDLRSAISDCEKIQDYVSRDLFGKILAAEEAHIDWIETQLQLLHSMGRKNYIQKHA